MRLVLAGASGFMGDHLLKRLDDEIEVYALSRRRPVHLRSSDFWIPCDFNDGVDTSVLPGQIDAVVHLAASYRHREFPDGAGDLFAVNTSSVVTLADYALRSGASRFVYASTGSVYASDGAASQTEDSPPAPAAFWAATKRAGEVLIEQYASEFEVWVPRLFFPYGADQANRLIPNLIASVREGATVTMQGDDDGMVLPPIHIDDVSDIVVTALRNGWSGTTNIAGPSVLSLREIVTEIGDQLGVAPVIQVTAGGPPPRFEPALGSLDSLYGLTRLRSFATGLSETLNYI